MVRAHLRDGPGTSRYRPRLGVLTNGVGHEQRAKLDALGLADRFDAVVISGEVGAAKPDAEIYRTAAERLPADSYAFVADDLERDVMPAIRTGWRGMYLDGTTDSTPPEAVPDGVAVLASLSACLDNRY